MHVVLGLSDHMVAFQCIVFITMKLLPQNIQTSLPLSAFQQATVIFSLFGSAQYAVQFAFAMA